jgi:subtilisin family serine protease
MNFIKLIINLIFIFCLISTKLYAQRIVIPLNQLKQLNNPKIIKILSPLNWVVIESNQQQSNDIQGQFIQNKSIKKRSKLDEQWHLSHLGISDELWNKTQGENIKIALIDTGIEKDHPDLSINIDWHGYDFVDDDNDPYDENGHGTMMAGLMVAECENNKNVCGVAPKAKIIPYRIGGDLYGNISFNSSNLAAAILAAADSDADIINLSLSMSESATWVTEAIDYAYKKGKIIVAAAGNNGQAQISFPANLSNVIAVGATDKNNNLLSRSNYGNNLSLTAPAIDLVTTFVGNSNFVTSDTSAACALTSATLALIKSVATKDNKIKTLTIDLLRGTKDLGFIGFDNKFGFGLLNTYNSIFKPVSTDKLQLHFPLQQVYNKNEIKKLSISLINIANSYQDVYLQQNIINNGNIERNYLVFQAEISQKVKAFNASIVSPLLFAEDLHNLPLFGDTAILNFNHNYHGFYEMTAGLFSNNKLFLDRWIIYLEN